MRRLVCVISVVLTGLSPLVMTAGEKAEDYLKDDKLKERFEVQLLQGGFPNYSGTYFAIEPDGSWSTGPVDVKGQKGKPKTEGKLTTEQLNRLAQTFASNDLARLPPLVPDPLGGPKMTIVTYGFRNSKFSLQPNKTYPPASKAIANRYAAIEQVVKDLCQEMK
jgi:hypothetical protein